MSFFAVTNLYRDRKWDGLRGQVIIGIGDNEASEDFYFSEEKIEQLNKEELLQFAMGRINAALQDVITTLENGMSHTISEAPYGKEETSRRSS